MKYMTALVGVSSLVVVAANCEYTPSVDYDCTNGATVANVISKEDCCKACQEHMGFNCVAGVWDQNNTCYLKGGLVSPKSTTNRVISCKAYDPSPASNFDCSDPAARCDQRIGATHWNPCYSVNPSLPSLIDGATAFAATGSKVIKVAVFTPKDNYPFNSPGWPENQEFGTLLSMIQHTYYRALFDMPQFSTYVLVAYSTVGGSAGGDISYWKSGITPAQKKEEQEQLYEAATWLLEKYGRFSMHAQLLQRWPYLHRLRMRCS